MDRSQHGQADPGKRPPMRAGDLAEGRTRGELPTQLGRRDTQIPRRVGELTFAIVSRHVHSIVLVTDEAVLAAQRLLWERLRVVAEPGGCAALAALLSGRYQPGPDEHVAVVLSGANTTSVDFGR